MALPAHGTHEHELMSRKTQPIAHSPCEGSETPQYLSTHLLNTATKGIGRLREVGVRHSQLVALVSDSGRFHDIGKATVPFYNYVAGPNNQLPNYAPGNWWMPHAIYGTLALADILSTPLRGRFLKLDVAERGTQRSHYTSLIQDELQAQLVLLYLIAKHHEGFKEPEEDFQVKIKAFTPYFLERSPPVGLHWVSLSQWDPVLKALEKKDFKSPVDNEAVYYERLIEQTRKWFVEACMFENPLVQPLPSRTMRLPFEDHVASYTAIRAAMGALTYGDCVDTANFYGNRRGVQSPLHDLKTQVEKKHQVLKQNAQEKGALPELIELRDKVFEACSNPSTTEAQIYLLNSPTGSAKTLGSLAFASAVQAQQIIYLLPFLSIVEQVVPELRSLGISDDILFTCLCPTRTKRSMMSMNWGRKSTETPWTE